MLWHIDGTSHLHSIGDTDLGAGQELGRIYGERGFYP